MRSTLAVAVFALALNAFAGTNVWTTGGPAGGIVQAVVIDSSGVVYVATDGGGVEKSTDHGATWVAMNNGLTEHRLICIAVSRSNPSILYVGSYSGGVFKSVDAGNSWISLGVTSYVESIAIDPTNANVAYAGSANTVVYRTTDGGATWSSLSSGLPSGAMIMALAVSPTDSATLYAGTAGSGVYKSGDGGSTWVASSSGMTGTNVRAIAINPASASDVLVGTLSGGGLWRSTDAGATWSNVAPVSYDQAEGISFNASGTAAYIAMPSAGAFKSANGGTSWTSINTGLTGTNPSRRIAVDPSNSTRLYTGGSNGMFVSTNDGTSWGTSSSGFIATQVSALAADPASASTVYAWSTSGLAKSTDTGASWTVLTSFPSGQSVKALLVDPATASLYAVGSGVFRSSNSGTSWSTLGSLGGQTGVAVAVDSATSSIYVATQSGGVFKSTNLGTSFSQSNSGLTTQQMTSLAMDPGTHTTLYAGTYGAGIFRSTDAGATWTALTALTSRYISDVEVDPVNSSTLYVSSNAGSPVGLFKSTDGGATWTTLRSDGIMKVVIDPTRTLNVYVGVDNARGGGVRRSIDGGSTWTSSTDAFSSGMPGMNVPALVVSPANHAVLYAGSQSNDASGGGGAFVFTSGPSIGSGPTVAWLSPTIVQISWTTDQSSDSTVQLNDGTTASSGSLVTNHTIQLTNLAACSDYTFTVTSRDSGGFSTSAQGGMNSGDAFDCVPPVISNMTITSVTSSSFQVNWTTNEAATSRVDYGTTADMPLAASDSTFVTAHSVTVSNVSAATMYYVRAASLDASTNTGYSGQVTVTTTRTNQPPVLTPIGDKSVAEGSLVSFTVTASDPDNDPVTYSVTNLPSGATFNTATGAFNWIPAYSQSGTYNNVSFAASDGYGGSASEAITITVTNTNRPPVLTAIGSKSVAEGSALVFSVSATDPDGDSVTYSTTNAPGGSSVDTTSGAFSWTPTYTQAGTYDKVIVTASDGMGGTASESITITVTDTNQPPVIVAASGLNRGRGGLLLSTSMATVSDPDDAAGTLLVTATDVPAGITIADIVNNAGTISGVVSASCDAVLGANNIALRVEDPHGGSATTTLTVNVTANAAPVLGTYQPATIAAGASTTVPPSSAPSDDGAFTTAATASTGFTGTLTVDGATGEVSIGSANAGSYTISVTATDNCGATASTSFTLSVMGSIPSNVVATATRNGSAYANIAVTWTGSTGAAAYEVLRTAKGGGPQVVGSSAQPSFVDPTAMEGEAYLYAVRAVDGAGNRSAASAPDLAVAMVFVDDPVVARTTVIQAVHFIQMRTAVNAVEALAGLGATQFTDSPLAGATIRAVHMQELRDALNTARQALHVPGVVYHNGGIGVGSTVAAVDLNDLRSGVR